MSSRDIMNAPRSNPAGSRDESEEVFRSRQAHALFGFRQKGTPVKLFAMDFLSTARHSGFGEAELKVIFNSCLDEPFEPAEMRRLRSLGFVDQLQIAMDREESRELSMAESSASLARIPEAQTLQIGFLGLSSPPAATPPPTSPVGKRRRKRLRRVVPSPVVPSPVVPSPVVPSPVVPSPVVPSPVVPSPVVPSPELPSP
ncbi:MAG: hypothetical protein ACRC7H_08665, partial [Plesiomonas shigelloides]